MPAHTVPDRRTATVEEAGRELGISRNAAYEAARSGELPSIRIGRRILVPRASLERMLGQIDERIAASDAKADA